MTVELQTGNMADVTSASDAELYAAMFGPGNYVLRNPLELKMEDANTLSVGPGNLSQNGRHIRLRGSTEFTIPSGIQAQKRSHLAVIRTTVTRDDDTMQTVEKSDCIVLSGEPTMDGNPEDPPIIEGNLLQGDTIADFKIARVVTDGINALEPVPLFETIPSREELCDSLSQTIKGTWQRISGGKGNGQWFSSPLLGARRIILAVEHDAHEALIVWQMATLEELERASASNPVVVSSLIEPQTYSISAYVSNGRIYAKNANYQFATVWIYGLV